jgi:predicted lipoprotein
MFAPRKEIVRLEGTIEAAIEARDALLRVRDLLPEGLDRDVVVGLAVQLSYAIENVQEK